MQVISSVLDFTKVASALSLSIANYKPIPIVDSSTSGSSSHGRVNTVNDGESWSSKHPSDSWGLPSILNISSTLSNDDGRIASSDGDSSGKTVGSGCKILDDYKSNSTLEVQFPSYNSTRANMMRYRKQVGVNGGAWFVQENWMSPSLFSCASGSKASELDILKGYGKSKKGIQSARARLEKHWDTWIQAKDFEEMKAMGINTLRLPIGYWNFPGSNFTKDTPFEPYSDVYKNSWKYILRAIKYADENDIGVLIDMHGAYGSQNGEPHSGVADGKVHFFKKENRERMTKLLLWLMNEVQNISNVIGIELLNEPHNDKRLWPWYSSAMDAMRKVSKQASSMPLYFHDAFNPSEGAKFVSKRSDFVVQDTHSYFVYTKQDRDMTASKHTSQVKGHVQESMSDMSSTARGNMIVGEWSCALNPNSLRSSKNQKKAMSEFCKAQTDTYLNATAGVIFWSWNMENCDNNAGWCFKSARSKYLDKTYNVWGLDGSVLSNSLPSIVSDIMKQRLPAEYSLKKSTNNRAAGLCGSKSGNSETASTAILPATSSTAEGHSYGRNAAVQKDSHNRSSKLTSSSSSTHHHSTKHKPTSSHHHHHHHHTHHTHSSSSSRTASSGHHSKKHKHVFHHRGLNKPHASVLERRGSKNSVRGYSDGFLTAKALAGLMALSRVGFEQQYLADTTSMYIENKIFSKNGKKPSSYDSDFKKGLKNLEKEVIKLAQKS